LTTEEALEMRGSGWDVNPGAAERSPEAVGRSRGPALGSREPGHVILVDGTAWIEYLRATGSPVDERVGELLRGGGRIGVTDLVAMKVLAGARDDAHRDRLRGLMARCEYLPIEAPADYERAADLHRRCRDAGVRIRHLPECLIAVVAMRHGAGVLHADADFDAIAGCAPLEIATLIAADPASGAAA
jgi:predicted nucleic acid-binding protein